MSSLDYMRLQLSYWRLTQRQEEVALLVIRGLGNREIAEKLSITEQTVKDHLRDIFLKAQVHKRSEFMAKVFGVVS